MGRANLLSKSGGIFHVTHRCHNRAFLLKLARDRDAYRAILREQLPGFDLWLLDDCLTSNHVHLLIDAEDRLEVSRLMRHAAGEFARVYNRRKGRMNAFWGDNFHATLVEDGSSSDILLTFWADQRNVLSSSRLTRVETAKRGAWLAARHLSAALCETLCAPLRFKPGNETFELTRVFNAKGAEVYAKDAEGIFNTYLCQLP